MLLFRKNVLIHIQINHFLLGFILLLNFFFMQYIYFCLPFLLLQFGCFSYCNRPWWPWFILVTRGQMHTYACKLFMIFMYSRFHTLYKYRFCKLCTFAYTTVVELLNNIDVDCITLYTGYILRVNTFMAIPRYQLFAYMHVKPKVTAWIMYLFISVNV